METCLNLLVVYLSDLLSEDFHVSPLKDFLPWQCFISTSSLVLSTYNALLKRLPEINPPKGNLSKGKNFQKIWYDMFLEEDEEDVNDSTIAASFTYSFRITNSGSFSNPQKFCYLIVGSDELDSPALVIESGLWDAHSREVDEDVMEGRRVTKGLAQASLLVPTRSRVVQDILFHGEKLLINNQSLFCISELHLFRSWDHRIYSHFDRDTRDLFQLLSSCHRDISHRSTDALRFINDATPTSPLNDPAWKTLILSWAWAILFFVVVGPFFKFNLRSISVHFPGPFASYFSWSGPNSRVTHL
ncbi:unnamed protein product [Arabidopsis lyrata]|uniref:Predicted protein n=1 Tax=Arabidopsis lyrata subsp. lyrata TaxID=81972 RepID=D7KK64_ARALL|nr:predicted protein [Arabidopsis lyrata subsp. lyrata]CAH8254135.1 unnamed protein product [Arabidopsis lyrata]